MTEEEELELLELEELEAQAGNIRPDIGQKLPKAKEPSFLSQALPFASRQLSRVSDAPIRGALSEVQRGGYSPATAMFAPVVGAAKGFMDPEGTPSGQKVAKGFGVPDRGVSMPAPQMSGMGAGMGFNRQQNMTFNPSQVVGVAGEMAAPVPLGPVLKLGAKVAGGAAKATNSVAATIANTTDEAMALMSTKAGRAEAGAINGKLLEVGENLVKAVKNAPSLIKEGEEVAKILPRVGEIKINKTVEVLENELERIKRSPTGVTAPGEVGPANKIQEYIDFLKGKSGAAFEAEKKNAVRGLESAIDAIEVERNAFLKSNPAAGPNFNVTGVKSKVGNYNDQIARIRNSIKEVHKSSPSAAYQEAYKGEEIMNLRRKLDDFIDYDMPGASEVENALFKARTQLKNDLIDAANKTGNVGYAKLMASWSDKLETANGLRRRIGVSSKKTDAELGQQLLSSLFGKNKEQAQEILADFDKTFGENFSRKAKVAQLVSEFNPAIKRTVTGDIQGRLGKAMEKYIDPMTKGASQYALVPGARGAAAGMDVMSNFVDRRLWPSLMAQLARESGRE